MFDYELVPVIDLSHLRECLPSQDFVEIYGPAYHRTWMDALDKIMDSPPDSAIVHQLMGEYVENGSFHTPVRVQLAQSDIEDHFTYEACVVNGMHRTTTSYIYGLPITFTYFYEYPEVEDDDEFTIARMTFDYLDESHDAYEESTGWFRSFRLADSTWVEGWTSTHGDGIITLWFDQKVDHELAFDALEKICENQFMSQFNWKKIELEDVTENSLYPPEEME